MNCKIFLTEIGWGPIVRQSAIANELARYGVNFTVQSTKNLDVIKRFFPKNTKILNKSNLIRFYSDKYGRINNLKTSEYYKNYSNFLKSWFTDNSSDLNYDFFISDMCPEALELGYKNNIPTFAICHFTWDWFFYQTIPLTTAPKILDLWEKYQKKATKFFFPPFTPKIILDNYPNKELTNFIISHKIKKNNKAKKKTNFNKIKILFLDSGDKIHTNQLKKIIFENKNNRKFKFYHPDNLGSFKNTIPINGKKFLGTYIPKVDIVIGRAGFNTITEVLYYKKPSIFLTSKNNPEINWNLAKLISSDLSQSIDIDYLSNNFSSIITDFLKYHSKIKIQNITNENFKFNGVKQISKKIIELL